MKFPGAPGPLKRPVHKLVPHIGRIPSPGVSGENAAVANFDRTIQPNFFIESTGDLENTLRTLAYGVLASAIVAASIAAVKFLVN